MGTYSVPSQALLLTPPFFLNINLFLYLLHVGVRRQLARVGSLPLCGAQESNSCPQVEQQVPLPTEPLAIP